MEQIGVEVEFRDILKDPPSREFLEKHVDGSRVADFLSKRSPVFKERPVPATKKQAIDLMLEQPTLIRRPVLVAGARVVFGFDPEEYRRLFRRPA